MNKKIKHPSDRASRRSAAAKALENKIFRQRKVDGKKKRFHEQIKEQEAEDDFKEWLSEDHRDVPVGGHSPQQDRGVVENDESRNRL